MSELREALAALEHEQWMAWAQNLAASEPISEKRRARWEPLFVPYDQLTEGSKDQDRKWADKVLNILAICTTTVDGAARRRVAELEAERDSSNASCNSLGLRLHAAEEERGKWHTATRVLCGAHVGVPQAACPVCERDAAQRDAATLRGALEGLLDGVWSRNGRGINEATVAAERTLAALAPAPAQATSEEGR